MEQAALRFNAEPFPIPRPFKEYRFDVGDMVAFRTRMGKFNNELIANMIAGLGTGPLQVLTIGTRKYKVQNEKGLEAWVPRLFLAPADVPSDE